MGWCKAVQQNQTQLPKDSLANPLPAVYISLRQSISRTAPHRAKRSPPRETGPRLDKRETSFVLLSFVLFFPARSPPRRIVARFFASPSGRQTGNEWLSKRQTVTPGNGREKIRRWTLGVRTGSERHFTSNCAFNRAIVALSFFERLYCVYGRSDEWFVRVVSFFFLFLHFFFNDIDLSFSRFRYEQMRIVRHRFACKFFIFKSTLFKIFKSLEVQTNDVCNFNLPYHFVMSSDCHEKLNLNEKNSEVFYSSQIIRAKHLR